ncbi:MAG: 3-dehydroquinate synthase [Planctomycetota bacterium]
MKTVHVATEPAYDVRIGRGLLAEVATSVRGYSRSAVLTDTSVDALYRKSLIGLAAAPVLAVAPGEDSKSFATLERVLDFMTECELDRAACLVALGGGVVGDLGGLAAALYARGIAFVQVPTTLLAQVDSSVGGKTAVNLRAGKNLAGVFHQPRLVLADTATLATLSDEEYRSGLGEVVKTALIAGDEALVLLEREIAAVRARDATVLAGIVELCVRTKAGIVARDPHEKGERKKLNLGHTFAHAIEHAAGFGRVPHGIAVAAGLGAALELSRACGVLRTPELADRTRKLLSDLSLPASIADVRRMYASELAPAALAHGMRTDKKSARGKPRFVLVERPGSLALDVEADPAAVERVLAN